MTPGPDPVKLTEIRLRAEAPIPRHRIRQEQLDVRYLIGHIDTLNLELFRRRDHHALYHADCTEGAA